MRLILLTLLFATTAHAAPAVSLEQLDELFGTTGANHEAQATPDGYRQYVKALLHEPAFYSVLTPKLFGGLDIDISFSLVKLLREGKTRAGETFYFTRERCDEQKLERVSPWWQPDRSVLVCPEDHRPNVLRANDGAFECDMRRTQVPSNGCGCGPRLMFCAPRPIADALEEATLDEVRGTVRYVVEHGRPLSDLLTMNETVRSGYGDFFYARNRFFQTGVFTPPDLSSPPMLRPRDALFQGGLLTQPYFLFVDSRRQNLANMWSDTLCQPFRSSMVEPHQMLEVSRGNPALRISGHLELARTTGCQNCHSRLEYGQLAFAGWENAYFGQHYDGKLVGDTKTTRLYVRDHNDLRAEGPATPAWLGKTIAAQPEYAACMAQKVMAWVYEGYPVPLLVRKALLSRFKDGYRLDSLIEDAVVARAFGAATITGAH